MSSKRPRAGVHAAARPRAAAVATVPAGAPAALIERLRAVPRPSAVEQIRELAEAITMAREHLDDLVVTARSDGASWHSIGVAVGITAEGARQRWGTR